MMSRLQGGCRELASSPCKAWISQIQQDYGPRYSILSGAAHVTARPLTDIGAHVVAIDVDSSKVRLHVVSLVCIIAVTDSTVVTHGYCKGMLMVQMRG